MNVCDTEMRKVRSRVTDLLSSSSRCIALAAPGSTKCVVHRVLPDFAPEADKSKVHWDPQPKRGEWDQ